MTKQGINETIPDFDFGFYNDRDFPLGYFVYAICVVTRFDPCIEKAIQAASLFFSGRYTNLRLKENQHHKHLRCFDLWKLHS